MEWHGYEQHPDAHPESPWWRIDRGTGFWPETRNAVRVDGLTASDLSHIEGDGAYTCKVIMDESLEDAMSRIDREHPLPCPAPRCGQVWHIERVGSVVQVQVHAVVDGRARFLATYPGGPALYPARFCGAECVPTIPYTVDIAEWPIPGAVLVAGPGSPWMDTREVVP